MAEFETIQARTISGRGVLKIPSDVVKNRALILYADVVRPPKNKYVNRNYNPEKSRYATLTFLRQDYVIAEMPMEYPKQSWDTIADIAGQTLIAVKCAYAGTLQSIYNLAVALSFTPGGVGLHPTTIDDLIKDYESLRFAWDEIRVVCYADTAISLRLTRLKYDTCDPEKDKDKPPPPPPPPPSPVPPGTPLTDPEPVSPPYDGDNDNGNTVPNPIDIPEEPVYEGTWTIRYANNGVVVVTKEYPGNASDTFSFETPGEGCDLAFSTKVVRNGNDVIEPLFNCNVDGFSSTIFDAVFTPNPPGG